ncbi:hypothetical protein ACRZOU_001245 [Aeromonas salmonicida]
MSKPKDAKARKQAQRSRDAALGIQRVEVRLSIREREQLETLRSARAGSGEPYSADEYISTLLRRDWVRWQQQQADLPELRMLSAGWMRRHLQGRASLRV